VCGRINRIAISEFQADFHQTLQKGTQLERRIQETIIGMAPKNRYFERDFDSMLRESGSIPDIASDLPFLHPFAVSIRGNRLLQEVSASQCYQKYLKLSSQAEA
jgi:hypothetical protein